MSVHPQVAVLLERVARSPIPPYYQLPPVVARRVYQDTRTVTSPPAPEMASVSLMLVPGPEGPLAVRAYRPASTTKTDMLPALIFYHGGGWVIGDLDTHDVVCRQLSNGSGCAVFSVEYRLSPEVRFPGAVQDCIAATRYITSHAAELGVDAKRIAVGGDSAGGNLAAVVCIDARDAKQPMPCFQLLIYPATDQRAGYASHERNAEGYLLTRKGMD
jgi:acetyl esterase